MTGMFASTVDKTAGYSIISCVQRAAEGTIRAWISRADRRPLVVRGARQVGKTWLIERVAENAVGAVATLNFERHPGAARAFADASPRTILRTVEALLGVGIHPGRCVLFLDEIQAAPEALARLRYFHEELPALHVVAAGSLLDFALAEPTFSVPVGRISYLHVEPMTFVEFLSALGEDQTARYLETVELAEPLAEVVHGRLLGLVREYAVTGGMPAVLEHYRQTRSWVGCAPLQHDLLATLRDDFHKYGTRASVVRLDRVLAAVPRLVGRKFKFSQVDADDRAAPLRAALELLCKARVCHRVRSTQGHGIPLAAEASDRVFKVIHMDTGLFLASLGLAPTTVQQASDLTLVNEGSLAEQLVGQMLRTLGPPFVEPALFYWQRDRPGAEAEVDYVIQHEQRVVPVEVKAGRPGSLRSLHRFVHERRLDLAVRVSSEPLQLAEVMTAVPGASPSRFRLLSVPLYLVDQLPRLLTAAG